MDEKQIERTERYLANQEDRGLVQVKVWVPANQREALIEYAGSLREKGRNTGKSARKRRRRQ